jgi:ABC-2 type transport system ATP-binding protein
MTDVSSPAAVTVRKLRKEYGANIAVADIDLDVRQGEIFGLLGPNGAGKTTTGGMITTRVIPTSGQALVGGVDVVTHPAEAKLRLGVVPQSNTLDRALSVEQNLYFHGRYFAMSKAVAKARSAELLEQFKLAERAKAPVAALSGGMAQRLMVARAIMHNPTVLVLDEPTSGLDPQSRLALWDILRSLNESGQSILLTTHYMEEADQLCDRIAIMDHGQILAIGTPEELKASVGATTTMTVAVTGDPNPLFEKLQTEFSGESETKLSLTHSGIRLIGSHVSGAAARVFLAAETLGVAISDIALEEPTLETVFINLTGRELRD